jgi:hypothetical protein
MDLFFETLERLTPQLRAGDLEGCEIAATEALRALPRTPFHIASEFDFTNDPTEAARHFDRFIRTACTSFKVGAVYTEMNGFDINPDRWYCDLFGFPEDGGIEDFDWLSDWESNDFEDYTLTGLEPLQAVYASPPFQNEANRDASYLCSILVVIKFQRFMQRASARMTELGAPLYVTAHDYEFIARILPNTGTPPPQDATGWRGFLSRFGKSRS